MNNLEITRPPVDLATEQVVWDDMLPQSHIALSLGNIDPDAEKQYASLTHSRLGVAHHVVAPLTMDKIGAYALLHFYSNSPPKDRLDIDDKAVASGICSFNVVQMAEWADNDLKSLSLDIVQLESDDTLDQSMWHRCATTIITQYALFLRNRMNTLSYVTIKPDLFPPEARDSWIQASLENGEKRYALPIDTPVSSNETLQKRFHSALSVPSTTA